MTQTEQSLINVTGADLARAFAEWDRRYREEPERFDTDMARMGRGQTVEEYGEDATAALLFYIEETIQ